MTRAMSWALCLLFLISVAEAEEPGTDTETGDPTDAWKMDEVVVTATRTKMLLDDAPDMIQVVTREEIEELHPFSTGELLEYVTGAGIETGTGSGLPQRSVVGLNGLPPQYTLVLVDGVRLLSEHIHTGRNVDLIPPQMIERIEIIRGADSAQYGADAIGGVINIVTRKCVNETETDLEGSAGSYDTYEAGATWLRPVWDTLRLSMLVHWEQSHGEPVLEPAHRVDNMGYKRLNLSGRIEADLGGHTTAYGWMHWVDNAMDWRDDTAYSSLLMGVLGTESTLSSTLRLFSQLSWSQWDAEVSEETNELLQPEAYVVWAPWENHTLIAGLDFKYHSFTRSQVRSEDQNTLGGFAQYEWRVIAPLTLTAALRVDWVEGLDPVVSPKATALLAPEGLPLRVRGSVSRGFHAPTPQELYEEGYGHGGRAYRFGNPLLKPEYGTTYGLGLEVFPWRPLDVALYGYFSELTDMIVPVYEGPWDEDPSVDVWRRINVGYAKVYGAEVRARWILCQYVRLEGGYSYTDSEESDTGRRLPYHPGSSLFVKAVGRARLPHDFRCSGFLGLRATFGRTAWSWKPAEGVPDWDPSGLTTHLADYQKLDAGVAVTYRDTYEAFFNVNNILGQDIENLDDVFTVLDGEPVFRGGVRARW